MNCEQVIKHIKNTVKKIDALQTRDMVAEKNILRTCDHALTLLNYADTLDAMRIARIWAEPNAHRLAGKTLHSSALIYNARAYEDTQQALDNLINIIKNWSKV